MPIVNTEAVNSTTTTATMISHMSHDHQTILANSGSSSQSQPTITSVSAQKSCGGKRINTFHQGICKLIEKNMLQISAVNSKGFRSDYILLNQDIEFRHEPPSPGA